MYTIFLIARTNQTFVLEIDPSFRLIDLKHMYAARLGWTDVSDMREFKFHFHGSVMYDDQKTLRDYGVPHEGYIREIPRLRGGAGILPYDRPTDVSGIRIKHKKTLII